jgi:hypothetical protein
VDCFVAFAPRNDVATHPRIPATQIAPELCGYIVPPENRGRRECRALDAPAALRAKVESTQASHHGHTGNTRHSLRNGFNGFLRALPGDRACLPPSSAELLPRDLTPASGRQDHTTSPSASSARRPQAPSASTASRLASVTIASRPSVRRDGAESAADLGLKSMTPIAADWHDGQISVRRWHPAQS